jgi:serine/threonine protein kinase
MNEQSDLFSLGIVLYELGTGMLPFQGKTSDAIKGAILDEWPVPPSQLNPLLPARMEEIILKALEKDRGVRYQHVADLGADLRRLKRDLDSNESRISASHLTSAPKRKDLRRSRWPLFTLSAVVVSAAICWLFWTPPIPPITGTFNSQMPEARSSPR